MAQNDGKNIGVDIKCDRKSHLYHVGENVVFSIQGPSGMAVKVELASDGGTFIDQFDVKLPYQLSATLPYPGFLRCTVLADHLDAIRCGVAFDPEMIRVTYPEPADFDEFWHKALAQLQTLPEDLRQTNCPELESADYRIYEVSCSNFDHSTVYGFLKVPKREHPVPLLVYFEGAGLGQSLETFQQHCRTVEKFLGLEIATLTIFTHNFKPGKTAAEHQKLYQDYLAKLGGSYWEENWGKDIKTTFFYRMILGASRMCNLVCALPEFDSERIGYLGASQGGGFGIYLTAICPQIKAAFCGVPAFGDFGGGKLGLHAPQSECHTFAEHAGELRYFDAAYFARRIQVPVFISLGYIDTACAPTSVMAIANNLGGRKLVFHKVENGHGDGPVEYEAFTWFWIKQHLEL